MDTPKLLDENPRRSLDEKTGTSAPVALVSALLAAVVKTEIATVDIKRQRELEERARVASMD